MDVYGHLQELTGKKQVVLTSSGNRAIEHALKIAKASGYATCHFPDQGGWLTYRKYAELAGLEAHEFPTDDGLIDFDTIPENTVLIFATTPAYAFDLTYDFAALKAKNIFVIADMCGSVGRWVPKSDISVCSFGRWKPINGFYGGCIAAQELSVPTDYHKSQLPILKKHIEALPEKLALFKRAREKAMQDLAHLPIVHKGDGINVLIKEKEETQAYCEKNKLPFRDTPFPIRMLAQGTSIEIKRLG